MSESLNSPYVLKRNIHTYIAYNQTDRETDTWTHTHHTHKPVHCPLLKSYHGTKKSIVPTNQLSFPTGHMPLLCLFVIYIHPTDSLSILLPIYPCRNLPPFNISQPPSAMSLSIRNHSFRKEVWGRDEGRGRARRKGEGLGGTGRG